MADDDKIPARADAGEIAAIGTAVGGLLQPYIGELSPHPRQFQRYRQSHQDDYQIFDLYRRTLADEQVYSTLNQRLDAVIAVSWEVKSGGPKLRDKQAAQRLKQELEGFDFNRICRQMLYGVYFGYAVGEAMWQPGADRVRLTDIKVRAPDRFRWQDSKLMLRTFEKPSGEMIPDAKFWLLARPGEHGDTPHGPGLARWCYWPAWMRRNGLRLWAIILERFGSPIPMGKYPKADQESQRALLSVLASFAAGAGIALPEGQDIEILHAMGSSGTEHGGFAKYMDASIAKVLLGQSSTTEQGPWRGTAEVQKDVRDETIISDCNLLNESIRTSIARWWTHWNFPGAAVPHVIRDASPPDDLDSLAEREEKISRMAGLRPTRKHVTETYGGEWEPAPVAPPPSMNDPATRLIPDLHMAASGSTRDGIDAAISAEIDADGWEPYLDPVIQPILAAAEDDGMTLETLRDRFSDLFAEMDTTEFVTVLRRLMFSSNLSGQTPQETNDVRSN